MLGVARSRVVVVPPAVPNVDVTRDGTDLVVNITGVDIQGKTKPERNSTITAKCVATTFVLLDKPVPPKPGAKPATPGKTS